GDDDSGEPARDAAGSDASGAIEPMGEGEHPAPPRAMPPPAPSTRSSSYSVPGTGQPAADDAGAAAPAASRQPVEGESGGFSATLERTLLIERALLREQLQRIELTQCDAIVTVEADQGHGRVWCVAGNVVDAEWQRSDTQATLRGEEAVLQILTLREGDVSVAFVPVNRPRLIALSTRELLGRALRRNTRPLPAPFAELEATGIRASVQAAQRTTLLYRPETSGVFPNTLPRASAWQNKVSLNTYLAGGVALIVLATVVLGIRQLSSGPASDSAGSEQVRVGTLKAGPAPDAVEIEVLPATAEIWLDSKHIGTGRVSQAPIRDGLVHQLRFVAPGYAPKSVFFRDVPAPGTVSLEPIAAADLSLKKAAAAANALPQPRPSAVPVSPRALQDAPPTSAAKHAEGLTSAQKAVVSESRRADRSIAERGPDPRASERRRHAAPVQRPAPALESKPPEEPVKPQVQVIEVRTPRVQVID
ncbi:MAG: DUF4388 domain-containing protein, partial [Polyangiaceae bacterium]